jgi:hypothetical protein
MISRHLLLKLSVCSSSVSAGRFASLRASVVSSPMQQRTIHYRSAILGHPSHISIQSGRQTVANSSTANNQIPITV